MTQLWNSRISACRASTRLVASCAPLQMGQQLLLSCCAAPANKIVAQPGTLTGSIGVLNGKINFGPALADQGVSHDSVEVGANSNASSPFADFTKAQIAIQERMVDDIYIDFMEKVRGCSGCAQAVSCLLPGDKGGCIVLPQQVQQLTTNLNWQGRKLPGEFEPCYQWLKEAAAARFC